MPLEREIPVIDDRRYEDILDEVRTRIARYTPEWQPVWTDLNDSDPGMTMVQVFAWMSEMLLQRMGYVPKLNYLKFLQLLGIEFIPAQSALTEITFPVKPNHTDPFVIISQKTQVSAEASDGGAPVVFETDRAIYALTAQLSMVQAYDGSSFNDVTSQNTAAEDSFQPFGPVAANDSALLLGFDYAGDFPEVELNLGVFVTQDTMKSGVFQCGLPESQVFAPARLRWEYWGLGNLWRSLSLLKDETRAFTRSGHVYLKTPIKGSMIKGEFGAAANNLFWVRALVERSQYERAPLILAVRTNTIGATQAETISDEVLGGSNGRRDQIFAVSNTPVLPASLVVEVDEGTGYQPWTRVDDFFGSGPSDRHFVLNPTAGEVRFGDGRNGAIPVGNIDNAGANVVARLYRFGGGKRGNVGARTVKTLLTSIEGIDDGKVENLLPAHSGRDEETLEEAKRRAPRAIKSRCRAVTAEDFEHFAMLASNIKRAKALPLFHPGFPGVKVPGVVTVIVVPDIDVPNPLPSESTLRTVCSYLDQRRLLTTELYVIKPSYQLVEVRAEVIIGNNADLAEVKLEIESALLRYFHPLKGGEDGQGWPFGGTIFFSRVYQRVFTVAGVDSVRRLTIKLDGEEMPDCTDIPIAEHGLVYSKVHDVQVEFSFPE